VKYPTGELDIFGRHVATKYFDNSSARRKYLDAAEGGICVMEALRPESEFLQKVFGDVAFEPGFNTQPVRTQTIDIETEISGSFMSPAQADNRVNMITVYDSETDRYYTWSLQHCERKFVEDPLKDYPEDKFVLFEFNDDEDEMLRHFVDWIDSNRASIIYGWNICGYDIPYLYTRISKQLGKTEAGRMSPVGRCYVREVNHDNARADVAAEIEVSIDGVFQSDGLRLYRDKFKIAGSTLDGGYSLDNVGEHEGLGHKIHYQGSLKDLYVRDWQKFYEYNVRDVDLCRRIDDKCKLTKLARTVAGIGLCNYDAIYTSLGYLIGSCVAFARNKMGGKVFKSYIKEKHQFSGFEGAFVFPCVPGFYDKGIACIDFASLYPSIIRALNISIETYVGKVLIYFRMPAGGLVCDQEHESRFNPFCDDDSVWGDDDNGVRRKVVINAGDPEIDHLELRLPGAKDSRKAITVEQLRKMIETKCIWTPNNTLFLKHEVKDGVVAKWCEFFYAQRKTNKKKELKIFHDLHNEEFVKGLSPEEKERLEIDEENYHSLQMALKIMINSVYGACGTAFSPIADPNIAQTITRMGRMANQSSAKFVHDEFVKRYNASPNYRGYASGDTDSCVYQTKLRIRM
jgi:DNA polymerase elongation subunit (family B)